MERLGAVIEILEARGILDRVTTLVVGDVQLNLGPPHLAPLARPAAVQRMTEQEALEQAKAETEAIMYGASEEPGV